MTLLESILAANRARAGGDRSARADLAPGAMPFVITCMDPRLIGNVLPALGLAAEPPPQAKFAGGIVRPGDVSGVRSVLAAAIFNAATEVLVVGHTDCRMGRLSSGDVRSGLQRLGVRNDAFGAEDPARWLGVFASERSAVQASVEALRADPRMPPRMPVHGLILHLDSGRLEVVVEGYAAAVAPAAAPGAALGGYRPGPASLDAPPAPVFGGYAPPRSPAPLGAPGPMPSLAAPGPAPSFAFPAPPPFAAPPPPPPPPVPPPSFTMPAPIASAGQMKELGETRDEPPSSPPPPPPPRKEPLHLHGKKGPKKKPGGSSPFDRAQEVLNRLRRDEDMDGAQEKLDRLRRDEER